jgi:hypothetical protein
MGKSTDHALHLPLCESPRKYPQVQRRQYVNPQVFIQAGNRTDNPPIDDYFHPFLRREVLT